MKIQSILALALVGLAQASDAPWHNCTKCTWSPEQITDPMRCIAATGACSAYACSEETLPDGNVSGAPVVDLRGGRLLPRLLPRLRRVQSPATRTVPAHTFEPKTFTLESLLYNEARMVSLATVLVNTPLNTARIMLADWLPTATLCSPRNAEPCSRVNCVPDHISA